MKSKKEFNKIYEELRTSKQKLLQTFNEINDMKKKK